MLSYHGSTRGTPALPAVVRFQDTELHVIRHHLQPPFVATRFHKLQDRHTDEFSADMQKARIFPLVAADPSCCAKNHQSSNHLEAMCPIDVPQHKQF